jgi:hypothetical protein
MEFKTFEQYEELCTLLISATATELHKFEEEHSLDLTIYPLMKSCYVICDNHAVQLLRKKFNIERDFVGEYSVKKHKYDFSLTMKNDYLSFVRKKRIATFVKGFSHPGIYNMSCYVTSNVDDYRLHFNLSLEAYDERQNVLKYLQNVLKKGFSKEDLILEKIKI